MMPAVIPQAVAKRGQNIDLPPGWERVRLRDISEINPRRPALSRAEDAPTTFVPMPAVAEAGAGITNPQQRPFREVRRGYTFFAEGDVLFAKITPCMQNGKHAIARNLIDGIGFGSTEFHVVRPGPRVTADWLLFYLSQPSVIEDATAQFTGAVGQQRVPQDYLATIEIPLVPLPQQRRITARFRDQLAEIAKARTAVEAKLEKVQALPTAQLRAVFTSPEVQKWQKQRLGGLATFKNGINFNRSQKGRGILTVDVLNMYSNDMFLKTENLYRVDVTPKEEYFLQKDDILFVRSSVKREGVGWPALFPGHQEPVTFCGFLIRAKLNKTQVHPHFLLHFLRQASVRDSMISASGQVAITNIGQGDLAQILFPTPPLADQQRIASQLSEQMLSAERLRQTLAEQLETINQLPAALLRDAFAGST